MLKRGVVDIYIFIIHLLEGMFTLASLVSGPLTTHPNVQRKRELELQVESTLMKNNDSYV
jgi:hypothetical protein